MARSGSDSGYHFVQDYRKCKKYFYHKYINMLEGIDTAPSLLFGSAMHAAMETWYELLKIGKPVHVRVQGAIERFEKEINEVRDKYSYEDTFSQDVERGITILRAYGLQYSNENWLVLAIEEDVEYQFDSGDKMTGRVDLVVKSSEGRVYLVDHKFTGWSMSNVIKSHQNSDQATAYKMMWDHKHLENPLNACIFNICRCYKGATDFHQLAIARTRQDVEEFKLDINSEYIEIANRVSDPNARWPKNTDRCMDYNRPCDYLPLCQGSNFDGLIGVKYKVREGAQDDQRD